MKFVNTKQRIQEKKLTGAGTMHCALLHCDSNATSHTEI